MRVRLKFSKWWVENYFVVARHSFLFILLLTSVYYNKFSQHVKQLFTFFDTCNVLQFDCVYAMLSQAFTKRRNKFKRHFQSNTDNKENVNFTFKVFQASTKLLKQTKTIKLIVTRLAKFTFLKFTRILAQFTLTTVKKVFQSIKERS